MPTIVAGPRPWPDGIPATRKKFLKMGPNAASPLILLKNKGELVPGVGCGGFFGWATERGWRSQATATANNQAERMQDGYRMAITDFSIVFGRLVISIT